MKYSWIAGNGAPGFLAPDSYSRTLLASINAAETTGVAYYGHGYGGTDVQDRLSITNFICNWTGPGNNQLNTVGQNKAQKQVLSKSANTWVATESLIDYAPTRSCANDSDGSLSGLSVASSSFTYGTASAMGQEKVIASGDVELVDISSMNDFDSMVDPTVHE